MTRMLLPGTYDYEAARRVGIHEAGHAWIAQCVGVRDFKASICTGLGSGQMVYTPPRHRYHARLIGLGGLVAELLDRHADLTPAQIVAAAADRACVSISPEDRAVTGHIDHQLAADALHLVGQNLGGIKAYSLELLQAALGQTPELAPGQRRKGCVYL